MLLINNQNSVRGGRENKTEKKEPQGTRTKVAGWRAKN
jgi:hypothetical protein